MSREESLYIDIGCEFAGSCFSCPFKLNKNGDCYYDWGKAEQREWLETAPGVLDIQFGEAINKKPSKNKFGFARCPECPKYRWVMYPGRINKLCQICAARKSALKAREAKMAYHYYPEYREFKKSEAVLSR